MINKILIWLVLGILLAPSSLTAQKFERQDSLRGTITKQRAWWDLLHYDIDVAIDIDKKSISGKNTIRYRVINSDSELQIDLQAPMKITSVQHEGELLPYRKEYSAYFIKLTKPQDPGSIEEISIGFEGTPPESSILPGTEVLFGKKI